MNNQQTGVDAENLAANYYVQRGFKILERNYRYRKAEIDIIARSKDLIVFIEVKFRKGNRYGYPEEFVSKNQRSLILSGADHYLTKIDWQKNIRFDIISIDAQMKITPFEDAFH
ncbi:YraN family protein [Reichenbachiella agarivorans]|uniref:UPF0102 protein N6H18_04250 n=1 Tax=Reichenbachiella agarivorans TaxID=2979464 RepID=A0ABY6CY67_9BACT|nr:YraN family protein [Reichenbachiella agarivorans]UXP33165.1 YraN family protein [Reichenbachiella agarivorans]